LYGIKNENGTCVKKIVVFRCIATDGVFIKGQNHQMSQNNCYILFFALVLHTVFH